MGCLQTLAGIKNTCAPSLGGIKRAWFANYDDFTFGVEESAHTITAVTATTGTSKFYEYEFNRQTGSLTSTITVDEANGVRYYTNTAALQFTKMEAEKHVEIEALAAGHLIGLFEDANDNIWVCGVDNYMSASDLNAQSGQAFGDLNGYTTSLSQMSAHLPYKIEYSTFKTYVDGYSA